MPKANVTDPRTFPERPNEFARIGQHPSIDRDSDSGWNAHGATLHKPASAVNRLAAWSH
jgi:hypothetical protein